jgi:hypothetical protein
MRSRLRRAEICELEKRETEKYAAAGLYSRWKSLFHSVLRELLEGTALVCEKNVDASHCWSRSYMIACGSSCICVSS